LKVCPFCAETLSALPATALLGFRLMAVEELLGDEESLLLPRSTPTMPADRW
jgi:hypothetical protein